MSNNPPSMWKFCVRNATESLRLDVPAVDPRDAVSKGLTARHSRGKLVGHHFEVPISVLQSAPGNADTSFSISCGELHVRVDVIPTPLDCLGNVSVPPYYIWANEDCANKAEHFTEAKAIRVELINDGAEEVYIVDANGNEVVDEEIKAHEALTAAGFFVGARSELVNPGFDGAFMVADRSHEDGYAIVGEHLGELMVEACEHHALITG